MRLLLDAHVSGARIGASLRRRGHDVRALDQHPELEGLSDDEALAAAERRILVTFNVADFPHIIREWGSAGRSHAGVILVHGIGRSEFGLVLRGVERWLAARPKQDDWLDFPAVVDRDFAAAGASFEPGNRPSCRGSRPRPSRRAVSGA